MLERVDISAYLVLGPENTLGRPVADIVAQAVRAGFTCVQVRSKECTARELIACTAEAACAIEEVGAKGRVALLVDDRLDVALAARQQGIAVDGVHVGQSDIPPEACRALLGPDAVVGLSAPVEKMISYAADLEPGIVDYLGVGPLHPTDTKPDCGLDEAGDVVTKGLADIAALARISPVPIVVGGGVKLADIASVAATGADGFFVVSAVCAAPDPYAAARELVLAWDAAVSASIVNGGHAGERRFEA